MRKAIMGDSMDIVCFANDWDGDPLSKKHIMRRLAAKGSRVLWVNSLGNRAPKLGNSGDRKRVLRKAMRFLRSATSGPRKVDHNIWVIDPIAVPVYGSEFAARANGALVSLHIRMACGKLGMTNPVHYTFVPASAWVAGRLDESLLVYHAADEYSAFGGADRDAVLALEDRLLQQADLYIACSAPLLDAKTGRSRESLLVRHGVEHEVFAKALDSSTVVPLELAKLPRPVVGFIGLIAEWVDLRLMGQVADALAASGGGSVVFVGDVRGADPMQLAALKARSNVLFAGRRPYTELAGWCKGFSVATLPFLVNELTLAANPLKLREYLAAGLPVVSTDIPEARALAVLAPDALEVANGLDFVAATVAKAHAADAGPRAERSKAVLSEGWDRKVHELEVALRGAISSKRRQEDRHAGT
jgi:glycosyltransferase involved in cell wall biosynthesis